jgi:hypothetical protein
MHVWSPGASSTTKCAEKSLTASPLADIDASFLLALCWHVLLLCTSSCEGACASNVDSTPQDKLGRWTKLWTKTARLQRLLSQRLLSQKACSGNQVPRSERTMQLQSLGYRLTDRKNATLVHVRRDACYSVTHYVRFDFEMRVRTKP